MQSQRPRGAHVKADSTLAWGWHTAIIITVTFGVGAFTTSQQVGTLGPHPFPAGPWTPPA